jgi:predicted amidohydrolase YtcJ
MRMRMMPHRLLIVATTIVFLLAHCGLALAGPAEVEAYQEMYTGSGMKARIRAYVFSAMAPKFVEAGIDVGYGDALMRVAGLKMVTDGSNQGYTGRQREPYVGKDSVGLFYMQPEETRDAVLADTRDGVPLSLHGNGDPRKVEPKAISDIKVSQTWMDGKQVYGG